ncbi:MAG: GIY-YIG nuclease family protein [Candidatus Colwellbacteria bacterium]|jgi:putative endonuclease|nr:GIY-YIG nuclease family protein [Candidatus Colwellbacteria bacterium]MCK9497373.1 GIY-YIG nuclease family protein [Candidatus Colwellbacteria bacterium]MDD3752727.1 GIY-YIG nuclease family protein [Candidatus Colwellbacteria bacterium]MDD4819120.1 GIY-YIG nuclease family protein [Candidatus Colwellbacteria bacterium]
MFYVYVLKSQKDGFLYTGYTKDLRKRFAEHNTGKTKSIKHRIPFKLVYYEAYLDKTDARKRELELKNKCQQREFLMDRIRNSLLV